MAKFKNKYRVESNRHRYWDYSFPRHYFITICTLNKECILGTITNDVMHLSDSGKIVNTEILNIPNYLPHVRLGEWVIMPNHVHIIVEIQPTVEKIHEFSLPALGTTAQEQQIYPWWYNPNHIPTPNEIKLYRKQRRKMTIPKLIGKFKMLTSKQMNLKQQFPHKQNWQSNYHDHIIRTEKSLHNISQYIIDNPKRWEQDIFHVSLSSSQNPK